MILLFEWVNERLTEIIVEDYTEPINLSLHFWPSLEDAYGYLWFSIIRKVENLCKQYTDNIFVLVELHIYHKWEKVDYPKSK